MGKLLDKAMALHRAGDLIAAERLYDGMYRRDRNDHHVAYLLGVLRLSQGRDAEALQPLRRAVLLVPKDFESVRACAEALDRLGPVTEAIAMHRRAVALRPDDASAQLALGCALLSGADTGAALASFERALALQPGSVEAHNNLGLALNRLGRIDEAKEAFEAASAAHPRHALAPYNLGKILAEHGDAEAALPWLRESIMRAPGFEEARIALAGAFHDTGRTNDAIDAVEAILDSAPDHPVAAVWRCTMELPAVYRTEAEVDVQRACYAAALVRLADKVGRDPARYGPGFAATRPFFLAYQGRDDRDLQARHGSLVTTALTAGVQAPPVSKRRRADKLRVGIVSGYFRDHSVWKIPTRGWLVGLDRARFEIVCYHTGVLADEQTREARQLADRFFETPADIGAWARRIADGDCDILLYPEIGMDPAATLLAALRLAPVQVNGLGHPVTSGLAAIDHALSSELMEPPDAQSHYTEALVRLPNLSIHYDYIDAPAENVTRQELGLPADAFVFWCGQSLFKYQPRYDDTFARIALAAPHVRFAFIEFRGRKRLTDLFAERLDRVFSQHGLRMENHCQVLPRLSTARFAAAAGRCDAILDSLGWSGFNSTMESLRHDLPLVTMESEFMRGRHGAAILRRMGLTETLASTPDAFVAAAVRLASDPAFAAEVRHATSRRKSLLFRDRACVDRLNDWLLDVGTAGRRAQR